MLCTDCPSSRPVDASNFLSKLYRLHRPGDRRWNGLDVTHAVDLELRIDINDALKAAEGGDKFAQTALRSGPNIHETFQLAPDLPSNYLHTNGKQREG